MLQVPLLTLHICNKSISSAYIITLYILHHSIYYPEAQANTNIINTIWKIHIWQHLKDNLSMHKPIIINEKNIDGNTRQSI